MGDNQSAAPTETASVLSTRPATFNDHSVAVVGSEPQPKGRPRLLSICSAFWLLVADWLLAAATRPALSPSSCHRLCASVIVSAPTADETIAATSSVNHSKRRLYSPATRCIAALNQSSTP